MDKLPGRTNQSHVLAKNLQYVYRYIFYLYCRVDKMKTRYPLYHKFVHVGIVRIDVWQEQLTTDKHHHHSGAIFYYSDKSLANQSTPPPAPGAYAEGVGGGQQSSVLCNLADCWLAERKSNY